MKGRRHMTIVRSGAMLACVLGLVLLPGIADSQGPGRKEPFTPRPVDAGIYKRIEQIRKVAAKIKIDGRADDWEGVPGFGDPPGDSTGDVSRDLVRVAIAPREDDLLILMETAQRPSQEDLAYWFNVDVLGKQPEDFQIGLSQTGVHTFWVFEEGKPAVQGQIRGIEAAINDVIEIRVPYKVLAAALPASMAAELTGEKARPVVRVMPFTWTSRTKQFTDYGPVVGCFRLSATPFPLDPPPVRNAKAVKAIDLPMTGKWFVGQGAYGVWTHQDVFAYDFYMVDATGHPSAPRDSRRNEDYMSWNQPVVAPLAGRVMRAKREAADQPPRSGTFAKSTEGVANEVLLDVGDGLGLAFYHFRRNTLAAGAGQRVEAGNLLGNVGNSGNSGWPHVHLGLWKLPEGKITLPLALANVRVSLNPGGEDPWVREFPQWDIREGYFVERLRR